LATARRACKLSLLVLPNRQGESHRTLAFVAVVFVHGHRGSSDWPAPRSVTRTKRSDTIPFRSPGKSQCGECRLLDDLICPLQRRRRNGQPKRLGGLEVDDEVELAGLLDRKVGGLRALEDFVHEGGSAPLQVKRAWAIKHKTAGLRVLAHPIYRGQAPLRRELCDLSSLIRKYGVRENHERTRPLPGHRGEGTVDLLGIPRLQSLKPHPQGPCGSLRLSQLGRAPRIGGIPE